LIMLGAVASRGCRCGRRGWRRGGAAVAAGGGEVGADAAVALQGGQGAPAAADLRGELVAADGVLGSYVTA